MLGQELPGATWRNALGRSYGACTGAADPTRNPGHRFFFADVPIGDEGWVLSENIERLTLKYPRLVNMTNFPQMSEREEYWSEWPCIWILSRMPMSCQREGGPCLANVKAFLFEID